MGLESERLAGEISELEGRRQSALGVERYAQIRDYLSPLEKSACQVAAVLGEDQSPRHSGPEYDMVFEYHELRIQKLGSVDNSFLEIVHNGEQVLRIDSYNNGVNAYVPGKWEREIEEWHRLAEMAQIHMEQYGE